MKKPSEFQLEKAQTAVIIIHVTCTPSAIRKEIDRKKHQIFRVSEGSRIHDLEKMFRLLTFSQPCPRVS
jgi:hypothetical protein